MIGYGKQSISKQDLRAIERVLKSDWLTQGPEVQAFEEEFANYVGAKYAVAVSNGTAALMLVGELLSINYGLINVPITVPDITFVADANAFDHCTFDVKLVDIQPNFPFMNHSQIQDDDTLVSVDMCGLPSYIPKRKGWTIRDACHSLGASWKHEDQWVHTGNCVNADFTVFSFHPVKHITTGEGGMVTTNNIDHYNELKRLRNHGFELKDGKYHLNTPGFNYRMSDIQAALGRSQLKRIDQFVDRRREIAYKYDEAFTNNGIKFVKQMYPDSESSYHLYTILTPARDVLRKRLHDNGIGTQVHYQPIHQFEYYYKDDKDYPNATKYGNEALSIPIYPDLTNRQVNDIIKLIIRNGLV